ncbi:MAG: NAD(+)/NADH kinase [Candidatus Mcinerneyibacterium aminivorans]|uniref:NAD kinase n=1 Tax=Candidatus Mcinerneyibacterium aminivorans TaxID=2703815 RepID=A0A5D0MFZ7_9BACT|nr:MAG: NAD(+)/NADH kinase [Candidatus Mcinerneyibacterium aminivorans]
MKVFLSINPKKRNKHRKSINRIRKWIDDNLNVVKDPDKADVIISMGGDGTLLYSITKYMNGYKYFGINLGHLGFLTSAVNTDCETVLKKIFIDGDYEEEKIFYLKYSYKNKKIKSAINDIVLKGGEIQEIINLDIYVNNSKIYRHTGDGVIVSTPIGSTAYNLSINGPILHPSIKAFILNNIAAHSLNIRPLVLHENDSVLIKPLKEVSLIADGNLIERINSEIEISLSDKNISIIRPRGWNFYELLPQKLHWGKRGDPEC